MSAAELRLYDFDGFVLDPLATGTCAGNFLVDFDIASQFPLEAVKADAAGDFPSFVRGDPMDKVIPLHITVREAPTVTGTLARINEMKEVFSPFKDPAYLRVVDSDDNLRRMLVKSLGVVPWEGHSDRAYVASLDADEPIWESDAMPVTAATISGSAAGGYSFGVVNNGNVRTYPEIRFYPMWVKDHAFDFNYLMSSQVAWASAFQGVDTQGLPYPIDITDGKWDTAALVAAGRLRTGCDDVAVFVDKVEVDRYIERPNTTGTSVWCSIPYEPAAACTVEAMTAALPALGDDLLTTNPEGTRGFPDVGVLLIDDEAIYYRGRTADRFQEILRSWQGTTNAIHVADSVARLVEHDIIVAYDCLVPDPLERADRKPMLDLPASSNTHHAYGSDGLIAPGTMRTGQWLRELVTPELSGPFMAQRQAAGNVQVEFGAPVGADENFDAVSLYVPCGFTTLDTMRFDYRPPTDGTCEIFWIGTAGYQSRAFRRDARGEGGGAYQVGTPAFENNVALLGPVGGAIRLTCKVRNDIVTGYYTNVYSHEWVVGPTNTREAQSFTLRQETQLWGLKFRVSKNGGSSRNLRVWITSFDQTTGPGTRLTPYVDIATADIAVAPDSVTVFFGDWIRLPAGKYAVVFSEQGGAGGTVSVWGEQDEPFYAAGERWQEVAGVWTRRDEDEIAFELLGRDAPNQPDADVSSGGLGDFNDIEVPLTTPPLIALSQLEQTAYIWRATLENITTGQLLNVLAPGRLSGNVEILVNTAEHMVQAPAWQGAAPRIARPSYVEPEDLQEWLRLDPGVNEIVFTEPNIGLGKVQIQFWVRDRWT